MKTTIKSYRFDTREPEEKAAYLELKKQLRGLGLKCFETWGGSGGGHYLQWAKDGLEIELETGSLFDNQWNTGPIEGISEQGHRVFDWAQDYPIDFSKSIKRGHYLELTPEMAEARRNTCKCRYCGKQEPAAKGYVFCPHCIGGEYLDEASLHLTRMKAIDDGSDCEPLTDAERAHLVPLYIEAQTTGNTERDKARIAAKRAQVLKEYETTTAHTLAKRDGFLWLMDRGINLDNVIYYDHKAQFCFGWRRPIDACLKDRLLEIISEFNFPYLLKCADGSELEGY